MKCPNCNKEILNDEGKCECGFEGVPKKDKKKFKTYLLLSIFAVIALIIISSLFIPTSKSGPDYIVAETKDSLYLIDVARPKKEPVLISKLTGESAFWEYYISEDNTKLLYTNNGKKDEKTYDTYYDLYLYDIVSGTSTLIDKNVFSHIVNDAFDTFTYFKGKTGELWQKKGNEEAKKLLDNVCSAKVSNDLKTIYYSDKAGGLYVFHTDKDPELISEKADVILFGDDCVIYCENEKTLIKYENGDKNVISESFYSSRYMTSEEGYFLADNKPINFSDSFIDDMLQSDNNIKPSDVDAYAQKLERDTMRLELAAADQSSLAQLCSLYYFNGKEAVKVCENVLETFYDSAMYSYKNDNNVIVYRVLDDYKLPKIKMSEIYNEDEIYPSINQTFFDSLASQSLLAFAEDGKQLGKFSLDGFDSYIYNKDTKTAYLHTMVLIDEDKDKYEENYYAVEFKNDTVTEPIIYDKNASYDITDFVGDKPVYCKFDENNEFFDIYLDKKLLIEKVSFAEWIDNSVLYIGKYNEKDEPADLLYIDSKFVTVPGIDNYENRLSTTKKSILCYNMDSNDAAIIINGKLIPLSDDIKYSSFYFTKVCDNAFEMTSPLYFSDFLGSLFAP